MMNYSAQKSLSRSVKKWPKSNQKLIKQGMVVATKSKTISSVVIPSQNNEIKFNIANKSKKIIENNKKSNKKFKNKKFELDKELKENLSNDLSKKINIKKNLLQTKSNIPFHNKSSESRYCLFFIRFGRCHSGDKCLFIHDSSKITVCRSFLQDECTKEKCLLSHKIDMEKMPVCHHFQNGLCYKENCNFRHVKLSDNTPVCKDFQKGFCKRGIECKSLHTYLFSVSFDKFCSETSHTTKQQMKDVKIIIDYPHLNKEGNGEDVLTEDLFIPFKNFYTENDINEVQIEENPDTFYQHYLPDILKNGTFSKD